MIKGNFSPGGGGKPHALGANLMSVVTSALLTVTIVMVVWAGPGGFGDRRDSSGAHSSGSGSSDNRALRVMSQAAAEPKNPLAECVDVITPFHEDDTLMFVKHGALESMKKRLVGVRRIYVVSKHKVRRLRRLRAHMQRNLHAVA